MAFYEEYPMSPLLIMELQLINLFNLTCLMGFVGLQIKYYLCLSSELYFVYFYNYLDPNYFETFFHLFLQIIPTSYQALLNFIKLDFFQDFFLRFYLVFSIWSYFLFVIFLNLYDQLFNVLCSCFQN